MAIITAIKPTAFKIKLGQISELSKREKKAVSFGQTLSVWRIKPARDKHVFIELNEPIVLDDGSTALTGYIYQNHWQGDGLHASEILLPIKWRSQRDNSRNPWRECNLTSHVMAIDYLKKKFCQTSFADESEVSGYSYDEPEDYYRSILEKYGDTTDHRAHTLALQDLGIRSYFSYTLGIEDLYSLLGLKIPVILGVSYKTSGHMVLAVGYERQKDHFLIHDPYGTRLGSRDAYDPIGGDFDPYSISLLEKIWVDQGYPHNPECGWGRVFVSVSGIQTGAKIGL